MDAVAGGGLGEAGDWDRGDTLGGRCVMIGGHGWVCVCVWCILFCVFLHTHWYVRMLFVRLVAGKSFQR
jgi:hypothetical protein